MPQTNESRPARGGSRDTFDEKTETTKNSPAAQEVCRDLIRQDIADQIDQHIRQLHASIAMLGAGSDAGAIHGLRRADAFWKAIRLNARELAAKAGCGQ
jgi:hypothetical protein